MWYNVDINKLVVLLVPTFLRKPKFLALLQALAVPLSRVHQAYYIKRLDNLYKLSHNGQVCYLRKALNDAFDPELRRIKIKDGNRYERTYIYTNAELKPRYLGKMDLRRAIDFGDTGVDFRVIVPNGFDLNNYHMKALVDFYRLASKRYNIEYE